MATEEHDIQAPLVGDQEIHPSPRVLSILTPAGFGAVPPHDHALVLWYEPSQKLVNEALFQDKIFGDLASRGTKVEGYGPEDLYQVGTAAAILKMRKADTTPSVCWFRGSNRFRSRSGWLRPYSPPGSTPSPRNTSPTWKWKALVSYVKGLFLKMMELLPDSCPPNWVPWSRN